jgi:membrane protein
VSANHVDPGSYDDDHARLRVRRTLWRTVTTYQSHGMMDHAASLTYYAMMSLFPSLLAGVAVLSLVGESSLAPKAADYLLDNGADPATADVARTTLENMISTSNGAAGLTLMVSFVLALNGASGAFAAAGRALNTVHGVEDDRSFVRRKLVDAGMALVVVTLFAVTVVAIFLGGGIADDLLGTIGLGETGAAIWSVARFPVAVAAAMLAYSLVYTYAPARTPRRWRWITPGAAAGVGIWLVASLAFAIYIRNFSSYGAAYGAFGAAIVLLLWLLLSANAFLLGAELNETIERARTVGRGGPPMVSPPPSAEEPTGSHPVARSGG